MNLRNLPLALLSALAVTLSLAAAPNLTNAAENSAPQTDDQCVAKCDEAADVCMTEAGEDEKKQGACDEKYEACQSKC